MQLFGEASGVNEPSALRVSSATVPWSFASTPATYTFLPSGLIAIACGKLMPVTLKHPLVPAPMQSFGAASSASEPLALRENSDTEPPSTMYTFLPSGLTATACDPARFAVDVVPHSGMVPMQLFGLDSCDSEPSGPAAFATGTAISAATTTPATIPAIRRNDVSPVHCDPHVCLANGPAYGFVAR